MTLQLPSSWEPPLLLTWKKDRFCGVTEEMQVLILDCPSWGATGEVKISAFCTGAGCIADWAGKGDNPPSASGRGEQGHLVRRAPFFTPWISVAGAPVEDAGLTHPWE